MTVTDERLASADRVRPDAISRTLHSEWTKLRTVRGWVIGLALTAVVIVAFGLLAASSTSGPCDAGEACALPMGPTGEAVTDTFAFVHRTLDGDGSIVARVGPLAAADTAESITVLQPWSKAGLIIKDGTSPGSTYAAVMITGTHGVRMQHDFVHDVASSDADAVADARWLRLTRRGDTIAGAASTDGVDWTPVASVELDDLPPSAEVGMFVTSPDYLEIERQVGGADASSGPTVAAASFDRVDVDGAAAGDWTSTAVGDHPLSSFEQDAGVFHIAGSGDIAPAAAGQSFGVSMPIEQSLIGLFAGLIVVAVVATSFVTGEYRRSLIHTTFSSTPRRGRVLAAKAAVVGGASFAVGAIAAATATVVGVRMIRANGGIVHPTDALTEVRVVVGTAAMLAVAAVLALATGTILRRSAGAVTAVIVAVVLPYILAVSSVLPLGPARWLLRTTPAAGFSIQQSVREYAHVDNDYSPANGFFPLGPWMGLAVLCAWTAAAVCLAAVLLQRRDA